MKFVKDFHGLIELFKATERKRVAVVCPDDESTEAVVYRCLNEKLAYLILVVNGEPTESMFKACAEHPDSATIVKADNIDACAAEGVRLVRNGDADILMKGSINTDNLLRAVLDKEHGLLPAGAIMSHITIAEAPAYDKLLIFSDVAVIPYPTLEQHEAMIRYDVELAHKLGNPNPYVALIHFTEKINKKFDYTLNYATIMERARAGEYGKCVVEGPMDIKTACDRHSAEMKHIESSVAGHCDIAIMPNLAAGNMLYKSLAFFGHAIMAGMLSGTSAPVVVPSRADSADSKFYSLALACVAANKG